MDARTLLATLDELAVGLGWKGGKPFLKLPPGLSDDRRKTLLMAVFEHREIVLRHYQGSTPAAGDCGDSGGDSDAGEWCGECEGWAFAGRDTGEISKLCGRVMCPYWQPGVGPDWYAAYRNKEEWRRRQKK